MNVPQMHIIVIARQHARIPLVLSFVNVPLILRAMEFLAHAK